MRWVDSTKFLITFSETLTDAANAFVHMPLQLPGYGAITKIPETGTVPPHTLDSLTHIYCYMYDLITAVKGVSQRQCQVFGITIWAFKWIFPSSTYQTK